jgi:hypothetical protein
MARFPITLDSDTTEVRDALEIARTQYVRGDLGDAMKWLRRAADIAFERGANERGVSLSKAAVELGPPRPPGPGASAAPPRASAAPVAAQPTPPPQPRATAPSPTPAPAAPVRSPAPARPETGTARMSPTRPSAQPAPVAQRVQSGAPPRASAPSPAPAPAPSARPAASGRASARPSARDSAELSTEPRGRSPVPDAAPIPLTARRAERPVITEDTASDEVTHVTGMSAGIAAALAFERAERVAPPAQPTPVAQPTPAAQPTAAVPRKGSVARAPVATTRPAPAVEDIQEETSPSFPLAAVLAKKAAAPVVHQAMRVALARAAGGAVTARALGTEGLRAGEVEVMVVGVAQVTDLAALFAE